MQFTPVAGVYVEEGPERDALTAALAKECYVPVYLDPKTVRFLASLFMPCQSRQETL